MLEKPKYLTGEVETFENYISSFLVALQTEYLKGWENLIKFSNIPEKADDWYFYDQPFETAMIEKYFKGWHKPNKSELTSIPFMDVYFFGNPNKYGLNKSNHYFASDDEDWFDGEPCISKCKTLNHFISDCKRAGIKLEWRE